MTLSPRTLIATVIAICVTASQVLAADRYFMYNLTAATPFTGVFLAPAGTSTWGANQALNDKDKAIDPSERLPIIGISRGSYDLKLIDPKGRTCMVHDVDLRKDNTFEVRDRDLVDCH